MKNSWCHGPLDATGEPMRLIVGAPVVRHDAAGTEVHYLLRLGSDETTASMLDTLSFRVNRRLDPAMIGVEPALAALLPFAMACQWDLTTGTPVSRAFLDALAEYALISDTWIEHWRYPRMEIPVADAGTGLPGGRAKAAFFSGGVDSMHTLVASREKPDDVIFLTGFDIEPAMTAHTRLARRSIDAVAAMAGAAVVVVETNVRALRYYPADWVYLGGSVLAGTALLLRGLYERVQVASDSTWNGCLAAHEHPVMHNLWRLPGFALRCTMVSTPRVERVRKIGSVMPGALAHLRVCWDMLPFHLNCGKCEKCQRTLAALEVVGFRELAAPGFATHELDWPMISTLRPDFMRRAYWEEIAGGARAAGRDDLTGPLDTMLRASVVEEIVRELEPMRKELVGTTAWKKKDPRLRDRFLDALLDLEPGWFWQKIRRHRDEWRAPLRGHLRSLGHAGPLALARARVARFFRRGHGTDTGEAPGTTG